VGLINTAIRDAWGDEGLQKLELLPDETFGHQCREPGHIAARMRQALHQTERDRVGHVYKNERNRRSSGVDRDNVLRVEGDDNLWTKRDELSRECGDLLGPGLRITILDLKIPAQDIAALV
jgi:hypothetical protein